MIIDLRCGRWQDALADVDHCDAVICDPPYSETTDRGFRSGNDVVAAPGLGYEPITEDDCRAFVCHWSPICRSWMVICCDHVTHRWWSSAMAAADRYVFPPVVIVKTRSARFTGDGPASHCEYIAVGRPKLKRFLKWGSLPGVYQMQTVRHGHGYHGVSGAKSVETMRAIIRDYSRPGDLVVDPFAGSGTTLIAARAEGRGFVGAEMSPETYKIARARVEKPYTLDIETIMRAHCSRVTKGTKNEY